MSHIEELLAKNASYSEGHAELGLIATSPTIILTCIDARTAPEHFLGLEVGEALVLRNMGGRVTPEVEYQIGTLCHIITSNGGQLPEILIIHHTDCGMQQLTPESRREVHVATGVPESFLATLPIDTLEESLATDTQAISDSPHITQGIVIRRAMYDVSSGLTSIP